MWDKNNRVEYLEANLQSLLNWQLGLPRAKLAKPISWCILHESFKVIPLPISP